MGISLSPFQPGQVIGNQPSAAPDPLSVLLAALTQGNELGVRGLEEQGRNSRSSAENEIQKAQLALQGKQLDLEMADKKMALEDQKMLGAALQVLMPNWLATGALQNIQPKDLGLPEGSGQPQQPQPVQQVTPMQGLEQVSAMLPARLRPKFLEMALAPTASAEREHQAAVTRQANAAALDKAILQAPEANRPGLKALATFEQMTPGMPDAVYRTNFPNLFPVDKPEWNPTVLNGVLDGMRESGMAFGQMRAAAGLPKNPAIADDFVLEKPEGAQQGVRARLAANFLQQATSADLKLRELEEAHGGLGLAGDVLRGAQGTGMIDALKRYAANTVTSPEQRQLAQANVAFAQAARFFMSGQQSAVAERGDFLAQYAVLKGDDAATKQQKQTSRMVLQMAIEGMTGGVLTRQQVIDQLLASPFVNDKQKEWIRKNAVTDEATFLRNSMNSVNPNSPLGGIAGQIDAATRRPR